MRDLGDADSAAVTTDIDTRRHVVRARQEERPQGKCNINYLFKPPELSMGPVAICYAHWINL